MNSRAPVTTIAHSLMRLAEKHSEAQGFEWFSEGSAADRWSWYELHRRACATALAIQRIAPANANIILSLPQSLAFIGAIFGVFYADCAAVPVYPPETPKNLLRFLRIVENSAASLVVTTSALAKKLRTLLGETRFGLPILCIDEISNDGSFEPRQLPNGDRLALLQYTSGTTGAPKGVMITHRNIVENERAIVRVYPQGDRPHVISWLPFFHDMGLIGGVFFPVFSGIGATLFSTTIFLHNPATWLRLISERGGTMSPAPNFAYDLCTRRVDDAALATLDLSSWCSAICGAEPIRVETITRFSERFATAGFKPSSFVFSYGLAESTLYVCAERNPDGAVFSAAHGDPANTSHACCGTTVAGEIRIVNPQTLLELPEGEVGEIWTKSQRVGSGYWRMPELSQQTFNARLANGGVGGFLRTGDLGFMRAGKLFVTGRLKELIILRGRNFVPQAIEAIARDAHPALRSGQCAAFSLEKNGGETLVIAQEVNRRELADLPLSHLQADIRLALRSSLSVEADDIVFVKQNSLPRTSSGKLQRAQTKILYLEAGLRIITDIATVEAT